jgi:hypothetical protein
VFSNIQVGGRHTSTDKVLKNTVLKRVIVFRADHRENLLLGTRLLGGRLTRLPHEPCQTDGIQLLNPSQRRALPLTAKHTTRRLGKVNEFLLVMLGNANDHVHARLITPCPKIPCRIRPRHSGQWQTTALFELLWSRLQQHVALRITIQLAMTSYLFRYGPQF